MQPDMYLLLSEGYKGQAKVTQTGETGYMHVMSPSTCQAKDHR